MAIRVHVTISGRVQGVWFRGSTQRLASRLGLRGWVRNLSDGRVEALFDGEEQAVRSALDFVRRGPPGAQVQKLVVDEHPTDISTAAGQDFEIRRDSGSR